VRLWVRGQETEEDAGIDSTLYLSAPPPGKASQTTNKMSKNRLSAAGDSSLIRQQSPKNGLGSPGAGEGNNGASRCLHAYLHTYLQVFTLHMYLHTYLHTYLPYLYYVVYTYLYYVVHYL
jgi:hypothetical protein